MSKQAEQCKCAGKCGVKRTFEEFLESYLMFHAINTSGRRCGQMWMHALVESNQELYLGVINTDLDPFYDDANIPAFLKHVADHWDG